MSCIFCNNAEHNRINCTNPILIKYRVTVLFLLKEEYNSLILNKDNNNETPINPIIPQTNPKPIPQTKPKPKTIKQTSICVYLKEKTQTPPIQPPTPPPNKLLLELPKLFENNVKNILNNNYTVFELNATFDYLKLNLKKLNKWFPFSTTDKHTIIINIIKMFLVLFNLTFSPTNEPFQLSYVNVILFNPVGFI
jgi:hypothetical protein